MTSAHVKSTLVFHYYHLICIFKTWSSVFFFIDGIFFIL